MKSFLLLTAVAGLFLRAEAKLNVVATLPDLAALARTIGSEWVEVTTLAKPTEDPHFVDARPSFVVKLRAADLLIDGGAELEQGWLPPLLQNARNPKIEFGAPGRVNASAGLQLLDVPKELTRSAGDVHALGNPHFMVDPIMAKVVAQHLAQAFAKIDSAHAVAYQSNYQHFETAIDAKLQIWGQAMQPFRGAQVVAYHDSWLYFAHRFGFNVDIFLEPKPGIPPSPSHLAHVIAQMKTFHAQAIIVEPFHNRKIAEKVAASTGARVIEFSQFPGGLPQTETYEALIDTLVAHLVNALKPAN